MIKAQRQVAMVIVSLPGYLTNLGYNFSLIYAVASIKSSFWQANRIKFSQIEVERKNI